MKIENGNSTNYTTADGLAGNWTTSFYEDHKGNLWISSVQGGLTRFRDGKFIAYDIKRGLFSDEIYSVVGDDDDNLWLCSSRGIGRLDSKELDDFADGKIESIHSQMYGIADGMKTDECYGGGWKGTDGHIWFATLCGAVMVDPKSFQKNIIPPPVYIEKTSR